MFDRERAKLFLCEVTFRQRRTSSVVVTECVTDAADLMRSISRLTNVSTYGCIIIGAAESTVVCAVSGTVYGLFVESGQQHHGTLHSG